MTGVLLLRYVIAVAGVVLVAPMVLFCLWPEVVRARFAGGADALDRMTPPAAKPLAAELLRMGFIALGMKTEATPLRPAVREVSFVAEDRRCYASIGLGSLGPRVYYFTPLPDGGFVLTSNGAFPRIQGERVVQRSFRGCTTQQLLEQHWQALADLGRRGEVVPTQQARIEATYAYYRTPEVRRILRRSGVLLVAWVGVVGWFLLR